MNRSHPQHFDDKTFLCSLHGLVDIQCCLDCEKEILETPVQKIERVIKLNNRIIELNMEDIGRLRIENSKLEDKLYALRNKK